MVFKCDRPMLDVHVSPARWPRNADYLISFTSDFCFRHVAPGAEKKPPDATSQSSAAIFGLWADKGTLLSQLELLNRWRLSSPQIFHAFGLVDERLRNKDRSEQSTLVIARFRPES